jgi:hypothetical protein
MMATTGGWLRNVNAAVGNPMKMLLSVLARDPRKCGRFRDQITRQYEIWARSDAKPVSTFADRAHGAGRQAEGMT